MTDLRRPRTRRLTGIDRPSRRPWAAVLVAALGAAFVIGLGFATTPEHPDHAVVTALNTLHTGAWGAVASAVYRGIEPIPAVGITLAIATLVWWVSRSLRTAVLFGTTVALTWLPVAAIKLLVDRPRPDATLLAHPFVPAQPDGSFPSGHTAYVVALAFGFWFLLRHTRWAWAPVVFGVAMTAFVGLAVVSDGLHFPTDVLGSVVWAVSTACAVRWIVVDLVAARVWPIRRIR
ncbi:phosphatase PAP2 family protein [uncultured Microbacterium sp.]|uniref:phosphatase PAP2 family protein n=1 Tax=uncultured Microbacterium sp. TaxID=191216 RepID=UPI0025EBFA2C|nr:phosphatase PAP2 family protein [uncultured Microbacterium sp.]